MLLVISNGIAHGRRFAFAAAMGCVSAGLVQIPVLALGLASIVNSSSVAHAALRWAGAAYLLYLGARLLFEKRRNDIHAEAANPSASVRQAFLQGVVSNLSNPATLAFMIALLPQFVSSEAGPLATQFVILGITMKLTGLVILGTIAVASGTLGARISRYPSMVTWQKRFAGGSLIALAICMLVGAESRARI